MSALSRRWRQTMTIARRDFVATVFTPIFLLFLFAPLIMASFGAIGGMGAAGVSAGAADKARLVLLLSAEETAMIRDADAVLRPLFGGESRPPELDWRTPAADTARQARTALDDTRVDVTAVLRGPLAHPAIVYAAGRRGDAQYLAALADRATLVAVAGAVTRPAARIERVVTAAPSQGGRKATAFFAVFGIFFLTLFLSGQVVGTMAEERNNKVIEVLAAAVPLESVFLGKLLGMFGVAVLFVGFWATIVSQGAQFLPADFASGMRQMVPAVGYGWFAILFAAYFTTAYLLLGSVFLGVGAQASTPREIQMLSLPITLVQVGMFALASAAAARPGTWIATLAEAFPLSSPFAMAGRAANSPALWPHLAALAWQFLWVALFIWTGARLFRRGVLQSGSARPRIFRRRH